VTGQTEIYILCAKKVEIGTHSDIWRVHRRSTNTTQDTIQRACANVEMHLCTSYSTCTSHVE